MSVQYREPTDKEIQEHIDSNRHKFGKRDHYHARAELREKFNGKPPNGYTDWGTYWKCF